VLNTRARSCEFCGARRSNEEVKRRLEALKKAAAEEPNSGVNGNVSSANTMLYIVDAVRAYATVGEICDALREVYGTYTEAKLHIDFRHVLRPSQPLDLLSSML